MERSEKRRRAWEALHAKCRTKTPEPYLGVHFECCQVYARIYRDAERKAYVGRCPRCLRSIVIRIRPDGTSHRFFRAY